jgi:hypothetical protein
MNWKVKHGLVLQVKHWSGEHMGSVAIPSETPIGAIHKGDRITFGEVFGWEESRLTTGRVEDVSHIFSGGPSECSHIMTVSVIADREP